MADRVGAYHDNGTPAYWIDAAGKPYTYATVNGVTSPTTRVYLSPAAVNPYGADPTKPQGSGVIHGHAQWDTTTGTWKQPINWGNLAAIGIGGAIAAPYVAGALAGGGGGTAATGASTTAAGTTAGTTAAAAGTTAATTGATVAGTHTIGSILGSTAGINGVNQGVGLLANYFANRSANKSNDRAAQLEAQAAAATLEFLKQQEATRHTEWQQTQEKNYQLYLEQQGRLAPYRQMGAGSLAQLAQPIPRGSGSTLADLLR